jgi:sirohydrochlorin cobaltochelatase
LKIHSAVILFAHGSRDPNWRLPFESIAHHVKQNHAGLTSLAFLENMQPDLLTAIGAMVEAGAREIKIVPMFLAVGSHVRKDLPELLTQARQAYPDIEITATQAIGENEAIQRAIADFALSENR